MALIRPIPSTNNGGLMPLLSVSGTQGISAATVRAVLISDSENQSFINKQLNSDSYTATGSDFSGSIGVFGDSTITILKAGTYLINNNGTVSTQTFAANDTVTVPVTPTRSDYWYMVKIS